jgi:serine/threonine protein kinase
MGSTPTLDVPGYQVIRFLGSGARSTIWQVRDRQTHDVLALKRVVKRTLSDVRFLEQAINEHDVGSQLDHPGIRHIYGMRRVKRWLRLREVHVMMEFCEGRSVQEDRPQDIRAALRIFLKVAAALAHMNARGFVHADTKPNNIIVSPDGVVKIIDFGQSCPVGTAKSRIQGTPDFIAPEQVHRRPVDGRTDVFNFGATLYWTLTARPIPTVLPKDASLPLGAVQRVAPPSRTNPGVPDALDRLVTDCIEPHPARRPASMNEVGSRLDLIAKQLARPGDDETDS